MAIHGKTTIPDNVRGDAERTGVGVLGDGVLGDGVLGDGVLGVGVHWLNDAEQRAWRAYLDGTRLLLQALDRQLSSDADLSLTDYELLVRLSEAPHGRLRMRDLADATLSTRSGVTRAVTRAERAGWVRRVDCQDDRRGMNAELTDAGREKLSASAPGHVGAVREHLLDLLTPAQLGQLTVIGERLIEDLAVK